MQENVSFNIGFTPSKKKFRLGSAGGATSRPKKSTMHEAKSGSQVSRLINMFERKDTKVHPSRDDEDSIGATGSLTRRSPLIGATGSLTRRSPLPQQRFSLSLAKRHLKRSIKRVLTPKAGRLRGYSEVDDVMGSDDVFQKDNAAHSPVSTISTPKLRLWSDANNNVSDDQTFKF